MFALKRVMRGNWEEAVLEYGTGSGRETIYVLNKFLQE